MFVEEFYKNDFCYYSRTSFDAAYTEPAQLDAAEKKLFALIDLEIDRGIEIVSEDRTPFDDIEFQFRLRGTDVKILIKKT